MHHGSLRQHQPVLHLVQIGLDWTKIPVAPLCQTWWRTRSPDATACSGQVTVTASGTGMQPCSNASSSGRLMHYGNAKSTYTFSLCAQAMTSPESRYESQQPIVHIPERMHISLEQVGPLCRPRCTKAIVEAVPILLGSKSSIQCLDIAELWQQQPPDRFQGAL